MKEIDVIIEKNKNGTFAAVPQNIDGIGFFGLGKSISEAKEDLLNSYKEAKIHKPDLDELFFIFHLEMIPKNNNACID